jgi:hypothetical protein
MRLFSNGSHGQYVAIEIKVPEIFGVPDFDFVEDEVEIALTAAERLWQHFKDRWVSIEAVLLEAHASP